MRKGMIILALCLMVIALTACGAETGEEDTAIETDEEAAEALEDVSADLEDISDSLEEINSDLG